MTESSTSKAWRIPRWLWVAGVFLAAVFIVTSPSNRHEAVDAYNYAAAVEFGHFEHLLHPHHLLYLPVINAIYEPAAALGLVERPLSTMVAFGSIAAAATCLFFVAVLKKLLGVSWALAAFGGGALASSYGFWRYAGEAEVYALAALLAVLVLWAGISIRPTWSGVMVLAALVVLAILGHVLNAALVAALPYILHHRGWRLAHLTKLALVSGAGLSAALLSAYFYKQSQGEAGAADGLISFFVGTGDPGGHSLVDFVAGLLVLGAAVGASNFIYGFEQGRRLLEGIFPENSLAEQMVMGTTSPGWLPWLSLVTLALLAVSALALIRRLRPGKFIRTPEGKFLILWLVGYFLIVFYGGNPRGPEGWILMLLPLYVLLVGALRAGPVRTLELVAMVTALAAHSLVGGFLPLYLGENRLAATSEWLHENANSNDLVITADSSVRARYIAYQIPIFAAHIGVGSDPVGDARLIASLVEEQAPTARLVAELQATGRVSRHRDAPQDSGRLYITADLFEPPSWLEASDPDAAAELRLLEDSLGRYFTPVDSTDYLVRTEEP